MSRPTKKRRMAGVLGTDAARTEQEPRILGSGSKAQPRSRSGGQPVPTLREPHRLEIHDLEVHHRIYERLGNEVLSYLVVLCRRCHQHYHGILPEAA